MTGRHLHHLQTPSEMSNKPHPKKLQQSLGQEVHLGYGVRLSAAQFTSYCIFPHFFVLTQWWCNCAAYDAIASGPGPVLRMWQGLEQAMGTARADCTSSPTDNGAEEHAKILLLDRVRRTQTSYCLHSMLERLCAFSWQHLAERMYILA